MSINIEAFSSYMNNLYTFHTVGADVQSRDTYLWTPLHWICERSDIELAMLLIEKGADINARDRWQRTPLHWCGYYGHVQMAIMMVEMGSDFNAVDHRQQTCLHLACNQHHEELAIELIRLGANIYLLDADNNAPQCDEEMISQFNRLWCQTNLIKSMHTNDFNQFKNLLYDINTDVNEIIGENSWNLLHAAVYLNQIDYIRLVLDKDRTNSFRRRSCRRAVNHRLDLVARCNREKLQSALHIACSKGHCEIVKILGQAILLSSE